jgi:uncharacterized membrane protein
MFVQIRWNPSRRDMRSFGWTLLAGLSAVGAALAWMSYRKTGAAGWSTFGFFAGAGAAVLLSSILLERTVGLWLYKAWMGLAFVLGRVMTPVVIGAFYFLVLTPIGLMTRLAGRDPMQRRKAGRATFWHPLRHRTDPSSYERQF